MQITVRDRRPAPPAPVPPDALARKLDAFAELEDIHAHMAMASEQIEGHIGRPVCVENCGLCCKTNTPVAWNVEVEYLVSWLLGQPKARREAVLARAKGWLGERELPVLAPWRSGGVKRATVGLPPGAMSKETYRGLQQEFQAVANGPCPFLGQDLRCMVWEARPLACRAYGVTYRAGNECPRPLGFGEDADTKAFYGGAGADYLKAQVQSLLRKLRPFPELSNWSIVPTAVFQRLRPKEYDRLAPTIAVAKRFMGTVAGIMLFQEQQNDKLGTGHFAAYTPEGEVTLEAL